MRTPGGGLSGPRRTIDCYLIGIFSVVVIFAVWSFLSSARVNGLWPFQSPETRPGDTREDTADASTALSESARKAIARADELTELLRPPHRSPQYQSSGSHDSHDRHCEIWEPERTRESLHWMPNIADHLQAIQQGASHVSSVYCIPTLYMIGSIKTGSTTLYDWLLQHPQIRPSQYKEPNYWNGCVTEPKPPDHTPLLQILGALGPAETTVTTTTTTANTLSLTSSNSTSDPENTHMRASWRDAAPGWWPDSPSFLRSAPDFPLAKGLPHHQIDASVTYAMCPDAVVRLKAAVPNARLVLLVRDPVDRFLSHYRMLAHFSPYEDRTITRALYDNLKWWNGCSQKLNISAQSSKDRYWCYGEGEVLCQRPTPTDVRSAQYLLSGAYDRFMDLWVGPDAFPREQVLVLSAEKIWADPLAAVLCIWKFYDLHIPETPDLVREWGLRFLNTDPRSDPARRRRSVFVDDAESKRVRQRLVEFYEPHMQRFFQQTGIDYRKGTRRGRNL